VVAALFIAAVTTFIVTRPTTENRMYIGVYQPNSPGSTNQIDAFANDLGFYPQVTSYYTNPFTMPFPTSFVAYCEAHGIMPLIQWQPRGTTNAAIAAGQLDTFIRSFADAVKSDNYQVIISYGQEMNGNWYEWGDVAGNTPAQYVAAYQHIWNIFHQQEVHNVSWLWDPNISDSGASSFKSWYPGDQYVDYVGLDGYFNTPQQTWQTLFAPSVQALRSFTSKPLMIGESGVTGAAGAGQLQSLFEGASQDGAIALVYFDEAQSGDSEHQDWRLEDNATNLAEFKSLAYQYMQRPLKWS
jgi:mannan endo-1,4-beta-mannosidase